MSIGISQSVREQLEEALRQDGFPPDSITIRREDGPLGTTVVTAQADGGYPGQGLRTGLMDRQSGDIYGTAFGDGLVQLAAARGWWSAPPAAADLAQVVNTVAFDRGLAIAADPAPTVESDGRGFILRLVREAFPSGARERVTVTVRPDADTQIVVEPELAEPIPITAATGLDRAIDADDAAAILGAIRDLAVAEKGPRDWAALARAAVIPNEAIALEAIMAMGASPGGIEALSAALADAPDRRDFVTSMVTAFVGPDAATRL